MKKYALAAAAALLFAGATAHAQDASPAALGMSYRHLDELCRGGSGDDPETIKACDQRNVVSARMRKLFNLCILTAEGDFEDCNTPVPSDDDDSAAARTAPTAPTEHANPAALDRTMDGLMQNATNVSACYRDAAFHVGGKLHQITVLGGDAAAALVENSCGLPEEGYMYYCKKAHRSEDQCIGDLKLIAVDAIQHSGN